MSIDLERQVRDYAEFLDSTLPVLDAEDAMVERLGDVPVRPLRERTLKPAVPGWVWAVGAAALTVIVGILAVVLLRLADEQADVIQPAPTTITSPPTTVPEGFEPEPVIEPAEEEPFTADSAIGTWTWTPIDVWSEPGPPMPEAFVDGRYLSDALVSVDGLNWSTAPAPTAFTGPRTGTRIFTDGETVHAVSEALIGDPPEFHSRLWRYDSGSWTEIPLPEVAPPEVEGLTLGTEWPQIDVLDSTVIVVFDYREISLLVDDNPDAPLTEPYGFAYAVPTEGGQIELRPAVEDPQQQVLLNASVVDGPPPRIEFRDADTGELVHAADATIPGVAPEELLTAILGYDTVYRAVFVGSAEGGFTQITVPWRGDEQIAAIDGELLALVDHGELWRSSDGVSWAVTTGPGIGLESGARLISGGERVFLSDGSLSLTSSDGRAWQPVHDLDGLDLQQVDRTSFGWFAVAGGHFGIPLSIHVSTDGVTWQDIGAPAEDNCDIAYIANTIFANCHEQDGSVHRWTATATGG